MSEARPSFNLFGHLSSRLGLGEAARNTARVLVRRGERFCSADIGPVVDVARESLDPAWNPVEAPAELSRGINIFHLNPPELLQTLVRVPALLPGLAPSVNAVVPFWELPVLPDAWVPICSDMDVILAPSLFVAEMCRRSCPGTQVIHFPQAVDPPNRVVVDRERWSMSARAAAFLCVFDVLSDVQRKNPWGAIHAFQEAFPGRTDVQLVMKVSNATSAQADLTQLARLRDLASGDSRIVLLEHSLSRADLWSLYASADVYLSLHRSEGLGLGMLEAMAVGTPAVATAWSGNMDFMTADDSVLVPFDLVSVSGTSIGAYQGDTEGQEWAEPREIDAVSALRRLADDRSAIEELGLRARDAAARIRERQSAGAAFDDLADMAGAVLRSEAHALRAARLISAVRRSKRRRKVVSLLRRLGLKSPAPAGEVAGALTLLDSAERARLVQDS